MTARAQVRGSWRPAAAGAWRLVRGLPWGALAGSLGRLGSTPEAVVAAWASVQPGRPALVDEAGELSYAGLADEVGRLRRLLCPHPELIVCSSRPRRVAVAVLAGLSAGCRVTLVPARAGELTLAGVRAALPDAPLLGDGAVWDDRPPAARPAGLPGRQESGEVRRPGDAGARPRERSGGVRPPERVGRRRAVLVISTSGTGGRPQPVDVRARLGVALQQLGLLGLVAVPPRPVVGCLAPLDHGHGFGVLGLTLLLGGTLLAGEAAGAAAPHLDLLTGVPVQLAGYRAGVRQRVRLVLSGSDRLTDAEAADLRGRLGAPVLNAYGATETGTVCVADEAARATAPGTVGRPLPGVRIRVVDEQGRPLPRGAEGRLEVRRGAGRPFRADRGRIDAAGFVHVTGRADGLRVSGGETVDPSALHAWLAGQPGVARVGLADEPDERFGSRPVVRLLVAPEASLDPEALRTRIAADLGPALVPARIDIVPA